MITAAFAINAMLFMTVSVLYGVNLGVAIQKDDAKLGKSSLVAIIGSMAMFALNASAIFWANH